MDIVQKGGGTHNKQHTDGLCDYWTDTAQRTESVKMSDVYIGPERFLKIPLGVKRQQKIGLFCF